MKPLKKPRRPEREVVTGAHRKVEKLWILEYKWNSEEDYKKKLDWWFWNEPYSEEWTSQRFGKYISPEHAASMIKKDFRTGAGWFKDRYLDKQWRVRHKKTGEIITINLETT